MKKLNFSIFVIVILFITGCSPQEKQLFPQAPGMVSYTYRNSFSKDIAATLDTIKSLGIVDMEFSNLFGSTALNIKAMLDERGMVCSTYGTGFSKLTDNTREVGADAIALGAEFVRIAWVPHDGLFTIEDAQKTVEAFNQAGKILKEEFGLSFCYHNHGYEFEPYQDGTLFDYIMENTDPNYVSFEIDILWTFFPGQDPADIISKNPERFKLMHLKDLRKGVEGNMSGGTAIENDVALGTGQLDIPAILKAAKAAGIKHYYIEDESPSYTTQVPQTIAYLKSLKN